LLDHCPSVSRYTRTMQSRTPTISYGAKNESDVAVRGVDPAWHEIENRSVVDGRKFSLIDLEQGRPVCLINDAVRTGKLAAVLAGIDDDGAASPAPGVHVRLPAAAQLATMPPSLLAVLPPLPRELEYRIVGRYLVLRDVDASLVLDYIANAVPR